MGETIVQLPRTMCGCTLGQTTNNDLFSKDSKIPQSENIPFLLAVSDHTIVYKGDFLVEGNHFAILSLSFYKDTLYRLEFHEIELNSEQWDVNQIFVKNLRLKYKDIADYLSNSNDVDGFVSVTKSDEKTHLIAHGAKHELIYKIEDARLAEEEWNNELQSVFGNIKSGPNYDEKNKDMLASIPCTVLCIRGNHEMRPTNPEIAEKYGLVTCMDGVPIGFVTWDPRKRLEYVEIGHNGIREKTMH